jgi:regulator of protease activity HflC (stomatin/prohibitin superfamily)
VRIDTQQATIEANNQIAAAKRQASIILAESQSLANALKQSIDQVGVEGTMRLKMAELYSDLTQAGAMPVVVVTEESIFASPFYPAAIKGLSTINFLRYAIL